MLLTTAWKSNEGPLEVAEGVRAKFDIQTRVEQIARHLDSLAGT